MEASRVEPFGFFTLEAALSGGVLSWELVRYVVGLPAALVAVGGWLSWRGMPVSGAVLVLIAGAALIVLARKHLPGIASRWSTRYYAQPLPAGANVWWEVTWRSTVVGFVASVALTPPTMVATSLQVAFSGGLLGALGTALVGVLFLANVAASVVASGWAMSRAVLRQLPLPAVGNTTTERPPIAPPVLPLDVAAPEARPAPVAPPTVTAQSPPSGGKHQCPKCGLYETERGSVIGWYCKVCGWREGRR
jgi:hypothetical protein